MHSRWSRFYRRNPKRWLLLIAALIPLVIAACTPPRQAPTVPTVQFFTVADEAIVSGDSTVLAWRVNGDFDNIELYANDELLADDLPATGNRTVQPTEDTEYELVVIHDSGDPLRRTVSVTVTTEDSAALTVDPAGPIGLAVGTAADITYTLDVEAGESTEIAWEVSDTAIATVAPATTDEATGTVTVTAVAEGTATLTGTATATDAAGDPITVTVEITVSDDPVAVSLTVSPTGPLEMAPSETQDVTYTLEVLGGASTEVTWSVDDETVATVAPATTDALTGTVTVTAVADGAATLTGTTTADDVDGTPIVVTVPITVTTEPVGEAPTIDSFAVEVVEGSQFTATWTATGATSYQIYSVNTTDATDAVLLEDVAATETSVTLPIPVSTHQVIRLVAINAGGEDSEDAAPLENVVLNTDDYDPYDGGTFTGEPIIDGTLRQIVADAPAGAIIGFAADVVDAEVIVLSGVEMDAWGDAHLYLGRDVTISGPAEGLTLQGGTNYVDGESPGDEFTYNSRMVYVADVATVRLENLTLTGGDFIYYGGGIRNAGDLTLDNVSVTGNRAWYSGGGIYNDGTLTLIDSVISTNSAGPYDEEVGENFQIRGNPAGLTGEITDGGWGGGIFHDEAATALTVENTTFSNNVAKRIGGALNTETGSGAISVSGSTFEGNVAGGETLGTAAAVTTRGGGAYIANEATFTGTVFVDNAADALTGATSAGGAIRVQPTGFVAVVDATITTNTADYGGAIYAAYCAPDGETDVLEISGTTEVTGNTSTLGSAQVESGSASASECGGAGLVSPDALILSTGQPGPALDRQGDSR